MENHLAVLEQQLEQQREQFDEVTADLRQELSVAEQQKASLRFEMETVVAGKEEEIQQLREGISNDEEMTQRQEELELEIAALRERLGRQEKEAIKAISLLEEQIGESNGRYEALQNDLETLRRTEPTELIELRESLAKSDNVARQWEGMSLLGDVWFLIMHEYVVMLSGLNSCSAPFSTCKRARRSSSRPRATTF